MKMLHRRFTNHPARTLLLGLAASLYFLPGLWLTSWHWTHPTGTAIAGTRIKPDWRWSVLPRLVNPGANGDALAELSSGCCIALFGRENVGVVEVIGQLPEAAYPTIMAMEQLDSKIMKIHGSNGESFCAFSRIAASALCTINRGDHLERIAMRGNPADIAFFTRLAKMLAGASGLD